METRNILAAAVIAALSGCGGPATTTNGKVSSFSIERDGEYVAGVSPVGNLRVELAATVRDGRLLTEAGDAAKVIGQRWNSRSLGFSRSIRAINVTVLAPHLKQHGSEEREQIIHMSFDPRTLGQTVHYGGDGDAVLAAAAELGWWTPTNDDVVIQYCSDHTDSQFCQKFVK